MGRQTRHFRQSKSSMSGNAGARNFGPIMREDAWHTKLIGYLKVRGKGVANKYRKEEKIDGKS